MKTRYAIQFAFEGTDYCGWQIQRGVGKYENSKPSIEGALVEAIRDLSGQNVTVVSSGRTDAGVHASGQVAHFDLENTSLSVSKGNLLSGLNDRLPESIQIRHLGEVANTFHAKKVVRKQYSYFFQLGPCNLPHLRNHTLWCRRPLEVEAMNQAVKALIGEHDFAAYCGARAQVSSTVREIFEAEVCLIPVQLPGCFDSEMHQLIRLRLVGSGFLKQMVRRIAGTLKKVGEAQLLPDEVGNILESGDRSRSGPTALAEGLWLDKVWYSDSYGVDFLSVVSD